MIESSQWLLLSVVFAACSCSSPSESTLDATVEPTADADGRADGGAELDAAVATPVTSFNVDIPMRDGKFLKGDIYLPDDKGVFPTIFMHTPYNKENCGGPLPEQATDECLRFAPDRFAYAIVDWRGKFASEAAAVESGVDCTNVLPFDRLQSPWSEGDCPFEGTDGVDVMTWIREQDWSDGKVGMWGISAPGSVQFKIIAQADVDGVPNLDCAVPSSATPETYYEHVFTGGILDYHHVATLVGVGFEAFLQFVVEHPTKAYEEWQYLDLVGLERANHVDIPLLLITGWWDTNPDFKARVLTLLQGPAKVHAGEMKLIAGPWHHSAIGHLNQGDLDFPAAEGFSDEQTERFFDSCLRQVDNGWSSEPAVRYFQMGSGEWRSSASWPPETTSRLRYYLRQGGALSVGAPGASEAPETFSHDPTAFDGVNESTWTSAGGNIVGYEDFSSHCSDETPPQSRRIACLLPGRSRSTIN